MLTVVSIIKLVAEIAVLALLGQWLLGILAGARREQNVFYRVLASVGRPFVVLAGHLTPRFVLARHHPLVAFLLLSFVWLIATVTKIQTCLSIGVHLCR